MTDMSATVVIAIVSGVLRLVQQLLTNTASKPIIPVTPKGKKLSHVD